MHPSALRVLLPQDLQETFLCRGFQEKGLGGLERALRRSFELPQRKGDGSGLIDVSADCLVRLSPYHP